MSYYRGAPTGGGMGFHFPTATFMVRRVLWTLVGAFVIQTLLETAFRGGPVRWLITSLAFNYGTQETGVVQVFPGLWQLLTYGLLHGGLWHLLSNMLGIYMFGGAVEERLGSRGFLRYFLVCVLGGGLLHWLAVALTQNSGVMVGASAGVIGVITAFALFYPQREVMLFPLPVPVKAWVIAVVFIAFDLYAAMNANSQMNSGAGGGVANFAHLGGAAAGFLYLRWLAGRRGSGGGWSLLDLRTRLFRWRMRRKRPFSVIQGDKRDRWTDH